MIPRSYADHDPPPPSVRPLLWCTGMLKITHSASTDPSAARLHVEGRIVGTAVHELERAVATVTADTAPILDFAGVSFIDHDGARALAALVRDGAAVVGCSPFVEEMLRTAHVAGVDDDSEDGVSIDDDERRLIVALRRGDPGAFEEVVRLHGGRMLAVARRMLRVEEDARDAVQEAFISAFKGLDGFAGTARLSTWLHRIVVNAALMRLRRQRRKPEESIDELLPRFDESGAWAESETPPATPLDLVDRAETRVIIRECIDRLPPSYRAILLLRDIEELDTDEAAAALGISVPAVKTRLHRARQALRTLLVQRLGI
ncbi:MAG TPA: sigma-70 family RNA polymerase sigma factor [Candidatus Binatia bacterium]|jgi:RNA polymerase sigma-70 factor (ECF subfamily)